MKEQLQEQEESDTVVPFQVLLGGKTPGKNWLADLKPGTTFASRLKDNWHFWDLSNYKIGYHTKKCTWLLELIDERTYLVDSQSFSDNHEMVERLDEPNE